MPFPAWTTQPTILASIAHAQEVAMSWMRRGATAALVLLGVGVEAGMAAERASGTFTVKVTPVTGAETGVADARLTVTKEFAGDLVGTSKGDMWTANTAVEGSAGYVAVEKIEGTLRGRKGGFTVLHQGTMRRNADYQIRIVIVPESGTGQLAGISGTMTIRIEGAAHFYELDYTLPD
jgi:hypothetical protein